jgi:uncharacterized RDD family membrane protein YckC
MDDAREWTATAPRGPAGTPAAIQPGDPWGAPLWASDPRDSRRDGESTARVPDTPAGIRRRGAALILDLALVLVLARAGIWLAAGIAALAPGVPLVAQAFGLTWLYVVPAAYFVLGHGTDGQTVGKRLVGARVVDVDGAPIGYARALGRYVATGLAILPFGLGLAAAVLRSDRRGLHDLLAATRVVRV